MAKLMKTMSMFTAQWEDAYSVVFPCRDMDTVVIATSGVWGTTTLTWKFQWAIALTNGGDAPTFSSAQSATNHRDYVQAVDLQSGANIPGDTGVTLAAASYNLYEINVSHLDYISIYLDRTAWAFTAVARWSVEWS